MKLLLLSFLLGIVSATGFEPLGLWPLTLLAIAALIALADRAPSLRSALGRGYWFGVGHFILGLNWIATAFTFQAKMPEWLGWLAVVLLALYIAVYPAMAAGLAWRWGTAKGIVPSPRHPRESGDPASSSLSDAAAPSQRDSRFRGNDVTFVLIFGAAWIVTEWLRAKMFTGFAWNPLGVAMLDTGVAPTARWVGTYGLSGIVVLLSGTGWLLLRRCRRDAVVLFAPMAILILAAQLTLSAPPPPRDIPVRIVQPNIGQQNKWRDNFELENFQRHAQLSLSGGGTRPRLLLWPEVAVTWPMQDERPHPIAQAEPEAVLNSLGALIAPGALLLTGGTAYLSADGWNVSGVTNSVFAVNASGEILGRYDKAHLTPYGEYLPMRPILTSIGLSQLAPGGDTDPGPGPRTLTLPLIGEVGLQICYEIIFSGEVVEPGNRPSFIFNPSNDAWFGAWGPPQHLAQARLRALEEGLPVLRATPTGTSAVIDANGRLLASLPWGQAGVIDAQLPAPKRPTLFARLGNILPFLFAGLIAAAAVAVRRKAR